jgi:hypothetical protein
MKLLASLIIAVSLALGAIAATTAYSPRLDAIDPAHERLTLNAPAGMQAREEPGRTLGRPQPIARAGTALTADVFAELRSAGVQRVRVKEFGWARWDYGWLLGFAVLGLILGAVMIRLERRQALAAALAPQAAGAAAVDSPDALLRGAAADLAALRSDLAGMRSDEERLEAILSRITKVQQRRFEPFVAARPMLIGRLGMAGYAQLMDSFAAAERQVNRAWSAAADGVLEESLYCLEAAQPLLDEAIARA